MTRPKDHLIAAAVSEIARLGPVCGTHQSFRQQVSQIIVPLVDGLAQTEAAPVVGEISRLLRARSPDKLLTEAADLIDYLEAQDGLLSRAQDEAARLRAELARLNENLAAANARVAELEGELATAQDLARWGH